MDADLSHVRQLIYSSASESEKAELRRKWLTEPLLKSRTRGVEQLQSEDKLSTGYLESRVDSELVALVEKRRKAAEEEAARQKTKLDSDTRALRTALSEDFIRSAGIRVANAQATFTFRDKPYTLANDKERGYLLNDEKLADAPGTLSDRIIATLVHSEDF
jgi:hypothetical protein